MGVREPAADGYRMLGVEYIGGRRVVDDDGVLKVATDLGEVLGRLVLCILKGGQNIP